MNTTEQEMRAEIERMEKEIAEERARFRAMSDEELIRVKNSTKSSVHEKRLAITNLAGRARGKAVRAKTTALQLRIARTLKSELEKTAKLCNMSVSDFVRMAIRNEIDEVNK